ncbi:MAG: AbrB/MazE/SpoVT family DNA-binding domain-containing protein [Candidatus Electrothrix sp. AW3_4]|nr:AbrB/MazE/SpoVT family DNA-binding domain-containing protein [Candidatus Electrothrix gigas]
MLSKIDLSRFFLATLTTKGQVTIPKKIRKLLRLHTGDKIEIIVTEKREAVIRPISKKVDDVFCKLHQPGQKAVSVDEMNKAVSRKLNEKFR